MITKLLERRAQWQVGGRPRDPALVEFFSGGGGTSSGVTVTPTRAMQVNAVMACVRLLSETMASLPLQVLKTLPQDGREPDPSHPLYDLLKRKPNRWQTSFEWRDYLGHSLLLRGFACAEIIPREDGYPFGELIPLHPDRVTPFRAPDGSRAYEYRPAVGGSRVILQDEMLYIPFLPDDGYKAVSVIKHMAETIGTAISAEQHAGTFFANDSTPGGTLEHPGQLSEEAQNRLYATWADRHAGTKKSRRLQILEEGMKFNAITVSPEDAQLLDSRKYSVSEMARGFGIPPHLIGDVDRSTSWGSGIEQMGIGFVTYTLRSLLVRIEQAMMRDLFTDASRETHFIEFNVDGLLRGDSKARWDVYALGKQNGVLSTNGILRRENMNPIGPEGDVLWQPMNMIVASTDGMSMQQRVEATDKLLRAGYDSDEVLAAMGLPPLKRTGPLVAPATAPATRAERLRLAYEPMFAEAAQRAFRRVENRKGTPDELRSAISRTMAPLVRSYAELLTDGMDVDAFTDAYLSGISERMHTQLLVAGGTVEAMATARARWEVVQEAGAAMRHALQGKRARWVRGDDCAFCGVLEGRIVEADAPFIAAGDVVEAEGQRFEAGQDFHHPPIHDGCTCSVEEE